jgi:hypothetical protein
LLPEKPWCPVFQLEYPITEGARGAIERERKAIAMERGRTDSRRGGGGVEGVLH